MHGRFLSHVVRLRTRAGLNSTRTAVVASRHQQNSSAARLSAEHQQQQKRQTRLLAPTEAHTTRLAQLLAADYRQGDCICLHGDVGAGKSFFSREFIRAAYDDPYLPVPSPTYLLQNIYDDLEGPPIHHFDLYRLSRALDLQRIGWSQALQAGVCLVEWPGVLGDQLPEQRLDIHISVAPKGVATEQQVVADSTHTSERGDCSEFEETEPRLIRLEYSSGWSDRMARVVRSLEEDRELVWRRP